MKIYKCSSLISISVVMPNGCAKHVSFEPMSDGSSLYFCNNKEVQQAIEKHSEFENKCITVYSSDEDEAVEKNENAPEPASEPVVNPATEAMAAPTEEPAEEPAAKSAVMEFACQDDVKDYIATEYGISRTQMRTMAGIKKAAESVGLNFTITE